MSKSSVLEKVNARRLLYIIQGSLTDSLEQHLFEPNVSPDVREYVERQATIIWTASPEARIELRTKTYYKQDMEKYIEDVVTLLEAGEEVNSDLYLKLPKPIERIILTAKFIPNA